MVHYTQSILFIIIRHFSFAVLFPRPRAKVVAFTVDEIPGGPKERLCKKEQWQTCTTLEGFSENVAVVNPKQTAAARTSTEYILRTNNRGQRVFDFARIHQRVRFSFPTPCGSPFHRSILALSSIGRQLQEGGTRLKTE